MEQPNLEVIQLLKGDSQVNIVIADLEQLTKSTAVEWQVILDHHKALRRLLAVAKCWDMYHLIWALVVATT